jgi:plasmid stabilization system protein ParE
LSPSGGAKKIYLTTARPNERGSGFRLHPKAAQDITGIWEYIAEDNPLAAGRVREQILAAIRGQVPFPHQGHKRPDLSSRPLRFRTVREYLIAYAPDETELSNAR